MSTDGRRICNPGNSKEFWGEVVKMQVAEDLKVLLRDITTEKPRPLKEFTMRVEGLKFRLIENWCLCKYCQLFDPANENFGNWISEFVACAEYLRGFEINQRVDKRKTITKLFIDEYDYNQERKALFVIREKFDALNINDMTKRNAIATIFVNSINGLIDVLANTQKSISEYIQSTFQSEEDPCDLARSAFGSEVVFLRGRHTELPSNVCILSGNDRSRPQIRIQRSKEPALRTGDMFGMTISDTPQVIGDAGVFLSPEDIEYFKNFIVKNREALHGYWIGNFDTCDLTSQLVF